MGTYGWNDAKKKADEVNTSGMYLKLEDDGDQAIVVWMGEPYAREVIWTGEGYLDADTDEGKAYLDNNPKKKASFRCAMNGLVLKKGHADNPKGHKVVNQMQIFENGVNWFNDLCKIKEKYGLGIWAFELQRNGKAKDPKTSYSMLPDTKVADWDGLADLIKSFESKLHDLADPKGESGSGDSSGSDGGATVSDDQKKELTAKLKPLGREVLNSFLTSFGIEQLKSLPAAKFDDAMKFCADNGSAPEPEKEPEEKDPFD